MSRLLDDPSQHPLFTSHEVDETIAETGAGIGRIRGQRSVVNGHFHLAELTAQVTRLSLRAMYYPSPTRRDGQVASFP